MKTMIIGLMGYVLVSMVWVVVENKPLVFVDDKGVVCGCMYEGDSPSIDQCDELNQEDRDNASVVRVSHC